MAKKDYNTELKIDKKTWLEILKDDITDQHTLDVLNVLLDSKDYEERAGIIAKKLKYRHCAAINGIISKYGYRIKNNYPKYKYPEDRFNVPLLGERKNGFFYWKLRPELVEALKAYKAE